MSTDYGALLTQLNRYSFFLWGLVRMRILTKEKSPTELLGFHVHGGGVIKLSLRLFQPRLRWYFALLPPRRLLLGKTVCLQKW